jgi:hypothetical protein
MAAIKEHKTPNRIIETGGKHSFLRKAYIAATMIATQPHPGPTTMNTDKRNHITPRIANAGGRIEVTAAICTVFRTHTGRQTGGTATSPAAIRKKTRRCMPREKRPAINVMTISPSDVRIPNIPGDGTNHVARTAKPSIQDLMVLILGGRIIAVFLFGLSASDLSGMR